MTNEELNQYLHEQIMGDHWHDSYRMVLDAWMPCSKCKLWKGPNPDYCNSFDAVAKPKGVVIRRHKWGRFLDALFRITTGSETKEIFCNADVLDMVDASPRQIAEACKEAWESK